MRIVDIGICVDNKDPKGLGRIRYKPYGTINSEIEKSITYEKWDENDQLMAIPFLPVHLNVVPQVRQSIKLIKYDTEKTTQNIEYVAGPFSTPHDFFNESFTSQHKNTTYGGVIVKNLPDLKDQNGKFIDKKSEDSIPRLDDFGIRGNYGSDLIFTDNGLILNGGKLISKETTNKKTRKRLQETPLLSEKFSKLTLKKFPQKMKYTEEDQIENQVVIDKVKFVVEYEIDDLETPTKLDIFVIKILDTFGEKFDTDKFNNSTSINLSEKNKYKLINLDGSLTGATFSIDVDDIDSACIELRQILYDINYKGLHYLNNLYIDEKLHPLYFRATDYFKLLTPSNTAQEENKQTIFECYKVSNILQSNALIFSEDSVDPPIKEIPIKKKVISKVNGSGEQSISSLTSDLLFLLSTDANKGSKPLINFNELSKYEFTQEDFLSKIEPGTYAFVRGEELIRILSLMYQFMVGHVHNINKPGIYLEEVERELSELINTMTTNLINKSIRIN